MSGNDALLAELAPIITDEMPPTADIADGSPVLSEGGARFHVDWKSSEAPHGRRRRKVVILFSDELLEALVQRREQDDQGHAQALELIGDEIASKFRAHGEDIRHDKWFITEELLSDEGDPEP